MGFLIIDVDVDSSHSGKHNSSSLIVFLSGALAVFKNTLELRSKTPHFVVPNTMTFVL